MWSSFLSVFRKEFLHILRDKGTLSAAIAIPVFQMILFGFIDQTVRDLPTVVVAQDRSTDSRLLIDQLEASRTFKVIEVTSDPHAARTEIISGRARVGVVIPPDFHDKRSRGEEAKILVLIDGSDSTASAQALASVNGLTASDNLLIAEQAGRPGGVQVQPTILFNPDGRTANYIIPGLVAILLQIVAVVMAAAAIVRERERGTLEQLLVTPVDPLGLMLGKLGPYLLVGLFEVTLILLVMRFGFSVPIRGNLPFLYFISLVYLCALLALGLFLSSSAETQAQAYQQAQLFLLPSIFLSGYIFPFEGLPWALRVIGICLPATHMVAIMRGIVLRGAGPMEMLPHVLALLAISVVLISASARRIRKMAA